MCAYCDVFEHPAIFWTNWMKCNAQSESGSVSHDVNTPQQWHVTKTRPCSLVKTCAAKAWDAAQKHAMLDARSARIYRQSLACPPEQPSPSWCGRCINLTHASVRSTANISVARTVIQRTRDATRPVNSNVANAAPISSATNRAPHRVPRACSRAPGNVFTNPVQWHVARYVGVI